MKHYMDISRIKETGESELTMSNTGAFEVGDHIQLTTKIDGSNASIALDEYGNLVAFSRKKELSYQDTLRGFWNYVQSLDKNKFVDLGKRVLFGEWLCLSGDTIIRKTSGGKNNNYMTLREMYNYLNSPTQDKYHYNPYKGNHSVLTYLNENDGQTFEELIELYKKYNIVKKWSYESSLNRIINYGLNRNYIKCNNNKYYITIEGRQECDSFLKRNNWWNRYGMPSIFSLFHDKDLVMANQIKNIVYTGDKVVYRITTRSGFSIKASAEHPFYTSNGYVKLSDLNINDCVAVTDFMNHHDNRRLGIGSREITTKQDEYKNKIGKCERCGSTEKLNLHHKNRNWKDNNESNWEVLCEKCHMEEHKNDKKFGGFIYTYFFDNIISIEEIGVEDCYDIEMNGDESCANFVANGFIVHNCKHTVVYYPESYNKWYVYDIYDKDTEQWLPQDEVKAFSESHGLLYVNVLYDGEFISWDHVRSFLNVKTPYGDTTEGLVVKNQSKLNDPDVRNPFYLKIVNDSFKETQLKNHIKKAVDPQQEEEKNKADEIANEVVTEARVRKEIFKMIDEGILPEKLQPSDMAIVARNLPKRIYDDVVKEELEHLSDSVGNQFFGKSVNSVAMNYARKIILGGE